MSAHKSIERTMEQYLASHAEPEKVIGEAFSAINTITPYQRCLVIPAFNESADFIQRIQHTFSQQTERLLIIVIINQPDNITNTNGNNALWNHLTQYYSATPVHSANQDNSIYSLLTIAPPIDILLVDRFHQKIPYKQGVGLARKIGGDIACQLFANHLLGNQWIHFSDADTHLPYDYFSSLEQNISQPTFNKNYSAAVYPYTHTASADAKLNWATQRYEDSLHYYVDGLKKAGSPYAYHTLGSCIASNIYHYCQARGFPKRSGGEDFYLLNKLAKLGEILQLDTPTLEIESRFSNRVPFGTGPAVAKIVASETSKNDARVDYHPQCFVELSKLIQGFNALFTYKKDITQTHQYTLWLTRFSPILQACLKTLDIDTLFTHIDKQIHTHERCIEHCHYWLDGFKTLKLIHLLSEHHHKIAVTHNNTHADKQRKDYEKTADQ